MTSCQQYRQEPNATLNEKTLFLLLIFMFWYASNHDHATITRTDL